MVLVELACYSFRCILSLYNAFYAQAAQKRIECDEQRTITWPYIYIYLVDCILYCMNKINRPHQHLEICNVPLQITVWVALGWRYRRPIRPLLMATWTCSPTQSRLIPSCWSVRTLKVRKHWYTGCCNRNYSCNWIIITVVTEVVNNVQVTIWLYRIMGSSVCNLGSVFYINMWRSTVTSLIPNLKVYYTRSDKIICLMYQLLPLVFILLKVITY